MVKKVLATSLLGAVLATAAMAEDATTIGVGVGLSNDSYVLRLPININKEVRVEPEFGLDYQNDTNNDHTGFLMGAGGYYMQQPAMNVNIYMGGKILVDYYHYDFGNGNDGTTTQIVLAPVGGFEYMFGSHVSVGGEAGVYLGFGDLTTVNTQGQAILRYFF